MVVPSRGEVEVTAARIKVTRYVTVTDQVLRTAKEEAARADQQIVSLRDVLGQGHQVKVMKGHAKAKASREGAKVIQGVVSTLKFCLL